MKRMKELRRQQERTQTNLAKLLGVSVATVSKLEAGKQQANAEQLLKMAKYFNVSVDFLLECEQTTYTNEMFDILKILESDQLFINEHCLTEEERKMRTGVINAIFHKYV